MRDLPTVHVVRHPRRRTTHGSASSSRSPPMRKVGMHSSLHRGGVEHRRVQQHHRLVVQRRNCVTCCMSAPDDAVERGSGTLRPPRGAGGVEDHLQVVRDRRGDRLGLGRQRSNAAPPAVLSPGTRPRARRRTSASPRQRTAARAPLNDDRPAGAVDAGSMATSCGRQAEADRHQHQPGVRAREVQLVDLAAVEDSVATRSPVWRAPRRARRRRPARGSVAQLAVACASRAPRAERLSLGPLQLAGRNAPAASSRLVHARTRPRHVATSPSSLHRLLVRARGARLR